jgi:hypothetical protein
LVVEEAGGVVAVEDAGTGGEVVVIGMYIGVGLVLTCEEDKLTVVLEDEVAETVAETVLLLLLPEIPELSKVDEGATEVGDERFLAEVVAAVTGVLKDKEMEIGALLLLLLPLVRE